MQGPQAQYTKELYQHFGYVATWTPATPVSLGDVGEMDGNVFQRLSGLEEMGIEFETRQGNARENLLYTSASGVNLNFKAAGSPVITGSSLVEQKAGATIEFEKKSGVVLVAKDCVSQSISDQISLGNEIIRLYNLGKWRKSYVVITEVKVADSMSVFISESSGGKIELIAENNLQLNTISLADFKANFSVGASSGINTQIIAQDKLTPLFKVRKLKIGFFGGVNFETTAVKSIDLDKIPEEIEIEEEKIVFEEFKPKFD